MLGKGLKSANTFVIIDLPLKMEVPVLAEHASFV